MTIKAPMGHSSLSSTVVYLRVANIVAGVGSPIDSATGAPARSGQAVSPVDAVAGLPW